MTRRVWAGSLGFPFLMAARPKLPKLIKPPLLQPGDLVGMITPASNVPNPEESYAKLDRNMQAIGLKVRFGDNVRKHGGYIAGPEDGRAADLHSMFADPAIKAVFCIRGGYGSPQLLDRIDYQLIRRNPKVFLGYSDITALHLAIHQKTGLVTFHGAAWNRELTPFTMEHLKRVLFQREPVGKIPVAPTHTVKALIPGKARGRLTGGNLSLITNLLGTPYEIQTRGAILCVEDVGEDPYRIDRMFTQLRLAGKLDGIAGLVWGECHNCVSKTAPPYLMTEVYDRILSKLKCPVLTGLQFGHTDDQAALPYGVMAELDAGKGELTITESAFRP
jgi:muramoyltetrapeptide carboxypeptidase